MLNENRILPNKGFKLSNTKKEFLVNSYINNSNNNYFVFFGKLIWVRVFNKTNDYKLIIMSNLLRIALKN